MSLNEVIAACPIKENEPGEPLSVYASNREANRLVFQNQFRGGDADPSLFRGTMLLAVLEQGVITEGLIEQRLDQGYATMGSAHHSFGFELGKIPPHARRRRAQSRDQFVERDAPFLPQLPQYMVCPISYRHRPSS